MGKARSERRAMLRAALEQAGHDSLRFAAEGLAAIDFTAAEQPGKGDAGNPRKRPTFSMLAYTGGVLSVGWGGPVYVDLEGLRAAEQVTVLLDHDRYAIVGQCSAVEITARQIKAAGIITGNVDDPEDAAGKVALHARNGFQWPCSIGVSVSKVEDVQAGAKSQVNGRTITGPAYVVRGGVLRELSFVSIGGDEKATAKVAASAAQPKESIMTFEQWLKARGKDIDALDPAEKAKLQAAYDAAKAAGVLDEPKPAEPPANQAPKPPLEASAGTSGLTPPAVVQASEGGADTLRAQATAERSRQAMISRLCAKHPDLAVKASAEGWDEARTTAEVKIAELQANRPKGPAVHTGAYAPSGPRVVEAALALSGRLVDVEKQFDAATLEAAGKFRAYGLQEMLLTAACAGGYSGRPVITRDNLRDVLRAAWTAGDISGILSNVANKFLLEGANSVEDTWRQICRFRNVSDLKQVISYRMTGAFQFLPVAPTGEIKHGQYGQESYTNQARTYGIMAAVTREDIINDDLGAITDTPRRIGRGGLLALVERFWAVFLDNATFFTAARANYMEGADTALGLAALAAGEVLFMNLTDEDGKPTASMPELLLTPPAIANTARSLYVSQEIRDSTANQKIAVGNTFQNRFRPLTSRYLSNSKLTGNSAAAWYLLANPQAAAAIEVALLNGQQSPTIESAEADFDVLGIQMRGYWDFGVALADHRAGIKSKGSA